jgi:hypothetical protein
MNASKSFGGPGTGARMRAFVISLSYLDSCDAEKLISPERRLSSTARVSEDQNRAA